MTRCQSLLDDGVHEFRGKETTYRPGLACAAQLPLGRSPMRCRAIDVRVRFIEDLPGQRASSGHSVAGEKRLEMNEPLSSKAIVLFRREHRHGSTCAAYPESNVSCPGKGIQPRPPPPSEPMGR